MDKSSRINQKPITINNNTDLENPISKNGAISILSNLHIQNRTQNVGSSLKPMEVTIADTSPWQVALFTNDKGLPSAQVSRNPVDKECIDNDVNPQNPRKRVAANTANQRKIVRFEPDANAQNEQVRDGAATNNNNNDTLLRIVSIEEDSYIGDIKDGKPNGRGTIRYANGTTYTGTWRNGKWDGHGIASFSDGRTYIGELKDGFAHGRGVMTFTDNRTYSGEFINGKLQGQGVMKFPDEGIYIGQFRDAKIQGQGKMLYPDGKTYTGTWGNGLANGLGRVTLPDGKIIIAEFRNGNANGQGKLILPNGQCSTVYYINGKEFGEVIDRSKKK